MNLCPHCQTPIEEHPANRCLDAWVAEKVMGWKPDPKEMDGDIPLFNRSKFSGTGVRWDKARHYSTSIKAAWEVVELFRCGGYPHPKGYSVACCINLYIYDGDMPDSMVEIWSPSLKKVRAFANDMPLAICRAALKGIS